MGEATNIPNRRRPNLRWLQRLIRDRRGSIAPIVALMLGPLLLASGATVDVARAVAARGDLQNAVDATALALAHLPSTTPTATLQTDAQGWINTELNGKNLGNMTVTATSAAGKITIAAQANMPTFVAGLAGISQIPVNASSTVQWGLNNVELSLVLDNTGSMAQDNKLTDLVSAATSLVNTLEASAGTNTSALKVGVVPFSIAVNVGSQYQTASWITGTQPSAYGSDIFTTSTNRFTMLSQMGTKWGGCVEDRPMPYDVQDTAPTTSNPATLFVPFFSPDEPDTTYKYGNQNYPYANSYLTDKSTDKTWQTQQGDPAKYTKAPASGSSSMTGYPLGPNAGCGTAALLRLTTNMSSVTTELNQMVANGDTHIPLGMAWGWHVLSPNTPFADGVPYGTANTLKIVVLVTDGQNTYTTGYNGGDNSFYTGIGYEWQNRISTATGSFTDPVTALNDRLATICTNMKAQNIIIYTVPVEVTDPTIQSLLQTCASSSSNYINVTSSSQLQAAFSNIAGQIGQLRIAK
jgi:Flp pilus assembly protein TadG